MALQMNLDKSATSLKLALSKAGVAPDIQAEISMDIDVSGSYDDELKNGMVDMLLGRLVPWAMVFDPDKQMDIFTFSSGKNSAHHAGTVTPETWEGFVRNKIVHHVPGYGGGTEYSHVLEKNLKHFGWLSDDEAGANPRPRGLLGRLFGGRQNVEQTAAPKVQKRSIILFNTDGSNTDQERTRRVLRDSQSRQDKVYFLFLAYSNQPETFSFLKDIGDEFSNTGMVAIRNLDRFVSQSDDELNNELLNEELITWLKA
jgi:hypothetical protein